MAWQVRGVNRTTGKDEVAVVEADGEAAAIRLTNHLVVESVKKMPDPYVKPIPNNPYPTDLQKAYADPDFPTGALGVALTLAGLLGCIASVIAAISAYVSSPREMKYGIEQWPSPWPFIIYGAIGVVGSLVVVGFARIILILDRIAKK